MADMYGEARHGREQELAERVLSLLVLPMHQALLVYCLLLAVTAPVLGEALR